MDDDRTPNRYPDPWADAADDAPRPSRLRNCLFVALSLVVVASLLASSLAAWFVIVRRDVTEGQQRAAEMAALATVAALTKPTVAAPAAAPATDSVAAPTLAPAAPSDGQAVNRIVIVNSEGQVETLSPTGADRRVLTEEGHNIFYQFPAWAPDGEHVAVIGSGLTGGGLYVLPDATTTAGAPDPRVYFSTERTPIYFYWSPDSRNLAFLAAHSRSTMGLSVVAGDGQGETRLLATGSPFYWDWTEDGSQLLIHNGQGGASGLSLIDIEGETKAGNLATPGDFQAPGIASGGRYWAFAEDDGRLSSLVVVDTQAGTRQTYQQSGSLALGWSPTRDQIAFTTGNVAGHPFWGPLQVLDVPGGETRLLSRQTVLAFFWSPDGRSIAFITFGEVNDGGIDALTTGKTVRTRLAPPQQGQGFLTLSVVDVDTGRGLRLLDFEPTLTYLSQFLPFFDQYALSHRVWSPDSSALVLPLREDGEEVVLVVPARGGRPYRLAEGAIGFWSEK